MTASYFTPLEVRCYIVPKLISNRPSTIDCPVIARELLTGFIPPKYHTPQKKKSVFFYTNLFLFKTNLCAKNEKAARETTPVITAPPRNFSPLRQVFFVSHINHSNAILTCFAISHYHISVVLKQGKRLPWRKPKTRQGGEYNAQN